MGLGRWVVSFAEGQEEETYSVPKAAPNTVWKEEQIYIWGSAYQEVLPGNSSDAPNKRDCRFMAHHLPQAQTASQLGTARANVSTYAHSNVAPVKLFQAELPPMPSA